MNFPDVLECLPEERQRSILVLLTEQGRVVASELARKFNTSEDTIRRDLRELAAAD
jgi:DeoR/GlpR family transcriptional regulator of sugar metabolism